MQRPFVQIWIGEYLADTRHLSTVQHGAYLLLIFHYWATGGLPDDDHQLANITGMRLAEWMANRAVLKAFFHDGWKHRRIENEIRRATEKIVQRKAAGSKGGTVASINRINRRFGTRQ
jgi:uncharacterized protein YdaU (DUF1376 family)